MQNYSILNHTNSYEIPNRFNKSENTKKIKEDVSVFSSDSKTCRKYIESDIGNYDDDIYSINSDSGKRFFDDYSIEKFNKNSKIDGASLSSIYDYPFKNIANSPFASENQDFYKIFNGVKTLFNN